jgi:hypothetical protein
MLLAVTVEDAVDRQTGKLEPLFHHARRDAELGGDGGPPLPLVGQLLERLELVGGMHGRAHFVSGKADLLARNVAFDLDSRSRCTARPNRRVSASLSPDD